LAELVPAHWQAGFIEAQDGTRSHYTRTGDAKPPVLLLHGVQVDGLMWLRTALALGNAYDVVMPDFRGHGKSGGIENGLSADMLVNDTMAVIRGLGLDKPFVIGHSMGADIAGRLAAVYPLRGAVLVDPALRNFAAMMPPMSSDSPPPWMNAIFEAMQLLRTQPHAERMVTGLRLLPPGTPIWSEADYVSFVEGQARFDVRAFPRLTKIGYLFEETDVIETIPCPILLLTARPMMPGADIAAGVAAFTTHWRDGQHIHFEDSGHFIPFDQYERFVEAIQGFMEG
jgi:pimeloyl-ACP methyl ester carboxylesterase